MDSKLILREIKRHYKFDRDIDLANFLGVAPQTLNGWRTRNTLDIELIYSKCVGINANWVLSGKGNMFEPQLESKVAVKNKNGIPLIPIDAMAGCLTDERTVLDYECERYVVPAFHGADFLITVKGSSMYPRYNSGDIVACKRVPPTDIFFQWNKVYVLDTSQGALIKRVKPGSCDDTLLIVSDNPDYQPFELPRSSIYSLAIVIGVIRLE